MAASSYCWKQIKMYQEVSGHQNLFDKQKARVKLDIVRVPHMETASLTIGLDRRGEKTIEGIDPQIHRSGVNTWGGSQTLLGRGRQKSLV